MAYIDKTDITVSMPVAELDRIISGDDCIIESEVLRAIELVKSFLRPRYDTTAIFAATGTNRNQMILSLTIDIVIYNLLSRVNNIDIPALRKERYDGNSPQQTGGAIGILKMIAKGTIEPDLPLREDGQTDQTGNVVMYGYASETTDRNTTF
ncbi:MAG: hypothetical protein RL259_583 [Bacteroidota bacterium]|jgi:hypothetical protein